VAFACLIVLLAISLTAATNLPAGSSSRPLCRAHCLTLCLVAANVDTAIGVGPCTTTGCSAIEFTPHGTRRAPAVVLPKLAAHNPPSGVAEAGNRPGDPTGAAPTWTSEAAWWGRLWIFRRSHRQMARREP